MSHQFIVFLANHVQLHEVVQCIFDGHRNLALEVCDFLVAFDFFIFPGLDNAGEFVYLFGLRKGYLGKIKHCFPKNGEEPVLIVYFPQFLVYFEII